MRLLGVKRRGVVDDLSGAMIANGADAGNSADPDCGGAGRSGYDDGAPGRVVIYW